MPLLRKPCNIAQVCIIDPRKASILPHFGKNGFHLIVGNNIGKQFCNHPLPDDCNIIGLCNGNAAHEHQEGKKQC